MTFEKTLQQISRQIPKKGEVYFDDFYRLLEWAEVYTFTPLGMRVAEGAVGFEFDGIRNALLFLTIEDAGVAFKNTDDTSIEKIRAREVLKRLTIGWGVLVDWGTDSEMRIPPSEVIRLNEYLGIWHVKQEANDSWLTQKHFEYSNQGFSELECQVQAKQEWEIINGFPITKHSRRDRRIDRFFAAKNSSEFTTDQSFYESLWATEYHSDPYLHFLTLEKLFHRIDALMINIEYSHREPLPPERTRIEWLELAHHVGVEFLRRNAHMGEISSLFNSTKYRAIDYNSKKQSSPDIPNGELFRYSKLEYLKPLIEHGKLKLFPASTYLDTDLLPAQRDNELMRKSLLDGSLAKVTHFRKNAIPRKLDVSGPVEVANKMKTDYYIWCTTSTYERRFYKDFNSDACLIIHDSARFIDLVHKAVESALPGWHGNSRLVSYYDPVNCNVQKLNNYHKDFRYAYQREYRFTWTPLQPLLFVDSISELDLYLGPLDEIASLVTNNG